MKLKIMNRSGPNRNHESSLWLDVEHEPGHSGHFELIGAVHEDLALHVVKCVNAHGRLMEALERCIPILQINVDDDVPLSDEAAECLKLVREALAAVKGGGE